MAELETEAWLAEDLERARTPTRSTIANLAPELTRREDPERVAEILE